ncbi:hypothetical protein D3875_11760 [Deinococcus cavernae]|uniref:Uncharacterized protein n=1 Tax=Deinococcus cavernae TaxID=2320857 RepID=A0A418V7R4_9DEIO|nr:hypothetical protein [Deinococcus cavernae]RJF72125.1 hypothetical protein D3875_11760 [Deinococcus cavernae]
MSSDAVQLLIAFLLAGLTLLVGFPMEVAPGRAVDALDAFLLVMSLVNLRLAWNAANGLNGGKAPAWFVGAGLLLAAWIAYGMIQALTLR